MLDRGKYPGMVAAHDGNCFLIGVRVDTFREEAEIASSRFCVRCLVLSPAVRKRRNSIYN
jgi:hypothetical protein